jgi:hypothetical protein
MRKMRYSWHVLKSTGLSDGQIAQAVEDALRATNDRRVTKVAEELNQLVMGQRSVWREE